MISPWVRQIDLGHALFHDRFGNLVLDDIGGRLRDEDSEARLLPDCFEFVQGELREHRVTERLPEFFHEEDEGIAGDQLFSQMQQVGDDRGAEFCLIEKLRIVIAKETVVTELLRVAGIVEHPAQGLAPGPFQQSRLETVLTRRRQIL
jgi:hypothetical protein